MERVNQVPEPPKLINPPPSKQPKPKRDKKGRLLKGQGSLNPGGRPKDMRTAQAELYKCLKKVQKKQGKNFLQDYIERAYKDKAMAIALLKKLVPDLKAIEVDKETKDTWQIVLQNFAKGKIKDV